MIEFAAAVSPVLFIALMILLFRAGVIITGIAGLLYTIAVVHLFFKTSFHVILLAVIDGVLTTMSVILVVYGGILLADILMGTGTLKRIGAFLSGRISGKPGKAIVLSFGLGNIFEGVGIIAEPLTAPLFYQENFTSEESASLSILGYSGLLTLEFAGIIMTVLSLASGVRTADLIMPVTGFSILASSLLMFLLPYIVSSHKWSKTDFSYLLLSALGLGLMVLLSAKYLTFAVSGVIGGVGLIGIVYLAGKSGVITGEQGEKKGERLGVTDLVPYGAIVILYLIANLVPSVRDPLARYFSFTVEIVKIHAITFRPFQDIYTFLFLAGYVAVKVNGGTIKYFGEVFLDNFPKSSRAAFAMVLFGAIGQVISFSGYDPTFTSLSTKGNLPFVIADGFFRYTGISYLFFVPLLGWAGTFLTGYGVASIMLFAKLQVSIGTLLGVNPALMASVLAVGAGVGSISSPFKVAIATPLCEGIGKEAMVLRKTIPSGIAVSLCLGVFLFLYWHLFRP